MDNAKRNVYYERRRTLRILRKERYIDVDIVSTWILRKETYIMQRDVPLLRIETYTTCTQAAYVHEEKCKTCMKIDEKIVEREVHCVYTSNKVSTKKHEKRAKRD